MARFKYSGRDRQKKRKGYVNASSKREAMVKLKDEGIRVIEIAEVPETLLTKDISFGTPVKLQDFVIYLRQFATLLKAGVTIVEATAILAEQTESKALKKALLDVEENIREGKSLSEAVSKHKKIFNTMFVNIIKAGEASGSMEESLERLAEHFEKQHDTRQKIVSALLYPCILGMIALGVVIFLLIAVVPTFVQMFADMGSKLPAITQFVLDASSFMQSFWWLLALIVIALIGTLIWLRSNKKTKYYLDYLLLRLPVLGKLLQKAALARMSRTLSSLFSSSVPILQAMEIVKRVAGNEVIAKVISEAHDSLEKGQSMTEPMKKNWVFPPLVTQMIAIGEETGTLDAMLSKVADFYEKEVEIVTDRLKTLIEPVMIVILAVLVGTIVLAIVVPMFDMYNQFQQNY